MKAQQISVPETCAVLCLDATADEVLIEKVLGPVNFERIDVAQNAFVTQVYDRTGSKSFWRDNQKDFAKLVSIANAWAEFGERPLIVGHKELADRLRENSDLSPRVQINHFAALRGSNEAEDCSVIFVTGRNMPSPLAVDLQSRSLFWDDTPPLIHDELANPVPTKDETKSFLPLVLKGFVQSDRNPMPQSGVKVPTFTDQRIEALHRQIRDAETMQAIGRLRLVHSPQMKRVFLLSNLPVEIPVDRYCSFDELMPDQLELELLRKGNLPLTGQGFLKMRPDMELKQNTANQKLNRSNVKKPSYFQSVPELKRATLIEASFKASASEGGRRHIHHHLFVIPNQSAQMSDDLPFFQSSIGHLPVDQWKQYLEQGDPEIEDSGWGEV